MTGSNAPSPSSRTLVGFTGGPRSSVASVLLKTQGIDVLAAFLDFAGSPWDTHCRGENRERAEARAKTLDIPLVVVPVAPIFEALVADAALHDVLAGRIPQTCLNCHSRVVLPVLQRIADEQGIARIATGHRGSLEEGDLRRTGGEASQADWLAFLPRALLGRLQLPLSSFTPEQVRKLAQEIRADDDPGNRARVGGHCALARGAWMEWTRARTPEELCRPGPIRWRGSLPLGDHLGVFENPVGSEIRLDPSRLRDARVPTDEKLLVAGIDEATATLQVLLASETARSEVEIENLNWIDPIPARGAPFVEVEAHIAGRTAESSAPAVRGTLFIHLERQARLVLSRPMAGLLRGAPLVFCSGDRVLATGWVA